MPGGYHCTAYREQMETSHYPQPAHAPLALGELQKSLEGISQKVLTDSLRSMEKDGLITRTVYPEVPPRVEYALSELGESMGPILDSMQAWGEAYQELVKNSSDS